MVEEGGGGNGDWVGKGRVVCAWSTLNCSRGVLGEVVLLKSSLLLLLLLSLSPGSSVGCEVSFLGLMSSKADDDGKCDHQKFCVDCCCVL